MTFRVVFVRDFRRELKHQVDNLDREETIRQLREEIDLLVDRLAEHPFLCAVESKALPIRRAVLKKMPFVVWYAVDEKRKRVVMTRFFHERQDRA